MNIISISLALIIVLFNSISGTDVSYCNTASCSAWTQATSESMTRNFNPCNGFYEFVCGDRQDLGSWFRETQSIEHQLSALISRIGQSDQDYLQKLKQYYVKCINDATVNETRNDDYKRILKSLGGWPILSEPNTWNEADFDWSKLMQSFRREGFHFSYFFDFSITSSIRNRKDRIIHLNIPKFGIDYKYLTNGFKDNTVKAYHRYIVDVAKLLGAKGNYEDELKKAVQFEMKLATIYSLAKQSKLQILPVQRLQSLYPSDIRWLDYLNGILSPYAEIDDTKPISVANDKFFANFSELMTKQKPLNRVLANYAFYRATLDFAHLLGPKIRTAHANFQLVFNEKQEEEEKSLACARNANKDMYVATSALYVKNLKNFNKTSAEELAKKIRDSFSTIIGEVGWLKNNMLLQAAKDKISKMVLNIGYPEELTNNQILSNYYNLLHFSKIDYFNITLDCNLFNLRKDLINFTTPFDKSDWTGPYANAARQNSFYDSSNSLFVPVGDIVNLFGPNDPGYINYAMLGFIIGRYMGYAFSTINRDFDSDGNFNNLLQNANNIECAVYQFQKYVDVATINQPMNSTILNNIIASVLGLKAANHAYRTAFNGKADDQILEFQQFTQDKMFWISYASMFCNANFNYNIQGLSKYHVNEVVSSLPEFSSAFQCPSTGVMSSLSKCDIWKNVN